MNKLIKNLISGAITDDYCDETIKLIQNKAIVGLNESAKALSIIGVSKNIDGKILIVEPNPVSAKKIVEELNKIKASVAMHFSEGDMQLIVGLKNHDYQWQRLECIYRLLNNNIKIICISSYALLHKLQKLEYYGKFELKQNTEIKNHKLIGMLIDLGYTRVDKVENKSEFAVRGDIFDVFTPNAKNPYRIEFFDDTIDSMREIDVLSQRSTSELQCIDIFQCSEYIISKDDRQRAAEKFRDLVKNSQNRVKNQSFLSNSETMEAIDRLEKLEENCDSILENGYFQNINLFSSVLFNKLVPIEELVKPELIIIDLQGKCEVDIKNKYESFKNDLSTGIEYGFSIPEQENQFFSPYSIEKRLKNYDKIYFDEQITEYYIKNDIEIIDSGLISLSDYFSTPEKIINELKHYEIDELNILYANEYRLKKILDLIGDEKLNYNAINKINIDITNSFYLKQSKTLYLSESLFFKQNKVQKEKNNSVEKISSFVDLNIGDYVVHENHGIAIYGGIKRIKADDVEKDYLLLDYKDKDQLYVPIEQFDKVQKYIGSKGDAPQLSKLGSKDFQNRKNKIKKSLRELAFNLVELYAKRKQNHGISFQTIPEFENEFAENFEYQLTFDQENAIEEVLQDMESPTNMDRLLCGDVGYGKTEIAMRAAFRAVLNGKQVAILAPTTVLAFQHYNNFLKRFKSFHTNIALLSRFNNSKMTKKAITEIREGKAEIVIGTHRLLSKDVEFKNLGLLIIDEEQRFGVAHKEQIKALKTSLDVLSLSATPIPRTLHMSLLGVRDLSLLETPPENRFPVQTYILDSNFGIMRDAILKELSRNGQTYILYNRVKDIYEFADKIKKVVPEAKIAVAHGQMSSSELENTIIDFTSGKFDVLICTTIIENGIDIPNANTLIVQNAEHLGLSQLYQIRGRVGRSRKEAYAYFMVKPNRELSENASKRLSAIREFNSFGAGFRIAMRDLEIRGSGNIFGAEQSGQISQIGYELYCKLIDESIKEVKGNFEHINESELITRIDLKLDAYIPDNYILDERQRIEIYKSISLVKNEEMSFELIDELIDRFGEPPKPVLNLIKVAILKSIANKLGCEQLIENNGFVILKLVPSYISNPNVYFKAINSCPSKFIISRTKLPSLILDCSNFDNAELLDFTIKACKDLLDNIHLIADSERL